MLRSQWFICLLSLFSDYVCSWLVFDQPGFSGTSAVLETDGRVTPVLQDSLVSCVKSLRPLKMVRRHRFPTSCNTERKKISRRRSFALMWVFQMWRHRWEQTSDAFQTKICCFSPVFLVQGGLRVTRPLDPKVRRTDRQMDADVQSCSQITGCDFCVSCVDYVVWEAAVPGSVQGAAGSHAPSEGHRGTRGRFISTGHGWNVCVFISHEMSDAVSISDRNIC